jgi:hypothetical protein
MYKIAHRREDPSGARRTKSSDEPELAFSNHCAVMNSRCPRNRYNRDEDKKQLASSVVFGTFSTREQVETAVDEMKREG